MKAFTSAAGFLVLVLSLAAQVRAADQPFIHPGILQTRQDLDFMKQKILAGEDPWKTTWQSLQASTRMNSTPNPVPNVSVGAFGANSVGGNDLSNSAQTAYGQAIQWYVTGDKSHAQKAIDSINAWSAMLQSIGGHDKKLKTGTTGYVFCAAAEILRGTDSGWDPKDIERFKQMMRNVYYDGIKDFFPDANGNWDGAMMTTMMSIGIFCDDRAIFDRAVHYYRLGIGNGAITHYVYASGQCEESLRDEGHVQLGLGMEALACRVAWIQGVDLYSVADNRLALGLEYTAKFNLGEDVPCQGMTKSMASRGNLRPIYASAFQHYRYVTGLDMPFTERAMKSTGFSNDDFWITNVLTQYQGPVPGSVATPSAAPKPSPIATEGGAQGKATAAPPADATIVAPGKPIQPALDALKGKGGWVVLGNGLHTLSAPLDIPSGVTLSGQGNTTVLWLNANLTGPAVAATDDHLHDVILRDFVIEGAVSNRRVADPNTYRMTLGDPKAPSRAGIAFGSSPSADLRNIRIEHVTVRNCTGTGVNLAGASGVSIINNDFNFNGGSAAGGAKTHPDLCLNGISGGTVTGNYLTNSPSGCGVDILNCKDITLTNNDASRNAWCGIHAATDANLVVSENLTEGNGDSGILTGDRCAGLIVQQNIARNNSGRGLEITRSADTVEKDNSAIDNAQ